MDTHTKCFGYTHHYIVDEMDLNQLPGDRNPAARLLAGQPLPLDLMATLTASLLKIEPDTLPYSLVNYHIDGTPRSHTFGFMLNLHYGYGCLCLCVESLIPGSFVYDSLQDKQLEGLFLLTINGIDIQALTDITDILDDVFDCPQPDSHLIMTGFTFLFGKLENSDTSKIDALSSEEHYHAISRSVFSLCLEAFADDNNDDAIISDELACLFLDMELIDPEFAADVWSILKSASDPQCPKSFSAALKEQVHQGKWIAAFYKHLDSCYALGTYGCPQIPPGEATVLPAVVVLKLLLDQLKQAAAHNIRVCVPGGLQVKGKDYEESYAHTILSHSLKIIIAVACCLAWLLFHFDIHNAFQSTPDAGDIHGNRSWLQINHLWLDYIRECKPEMWTKVSDLLQTHSVDELAVEMFKFVQGRVDASRKWGEHIEAVIFTDFGLLPNRADPAVYSGIFQGNAVILGQATDDFLCACEHETTYLAIVAVFEQRWTVHALGLVDTFFGLHLYHPKTLSRWSRTSRPIRSSPKFLVHRGKINYRHLLTVFQ
jgi:hypothetical protein